MSRSNSVFQDKRAEFLRPSSQDLPSGRATFLRGSGTGWPPLPVGAQSCHGLVCPVLPPFVRSLTVEVLAGSASLLTVCPAGSVAGTVLRASFLYLTLFFC